LANWLTKLQVPVARVFCPLFFGGGFVSQSGYLGFNVITDIHQRIVDSLIGQRVSMKVSPKRPQALRFMLGDDSQVEIM
jgi:hypothetical protein